MTVPSALLPSPPASARRALARAGAALAAAALVAACERGDRHERKAPPTASPGAVVTSSAGAAAPAASTAPRPLPPVATDSVTVRADRGRIQGDSAAPVWVVVISDFQCPYCKQWHDAVYPSLKRDYVDTRRVRLAYINYPVRGHQNAWPAAQAAMCASAQGRFWQMHDAIFATQARWSPQPSAQPLFDSLAASVAVRDLAAWRKCVKDEALRPLIQADQERSVRAGIRATPTFIIGQAVVEGALGLDEMKVRLDSALAVAAGGAAPRR
ncbi:MAG: DsbA family protein [Gemmatimonadaceae bacterium]